MAPKSLGSSPQSLSPTHSRAPKGGSNPTSRAISRLSFTAENLIRPSSASSTPRRRSAAGGGGGDQAASNAAIQLERGNTWPLIAALELDRRREALDLIKRNVGIHSVNDDLTTCEMIAARKNNLECLELLLDRKPNGVNAADSFGWTALMYSCYYGHSEICKRLLLAGAQVDMYDNDRMSALMWAAGRGHLDCVSHLMQFGRAKPNQVDKCGTSALIWACRKGYVEVASMLLKAGANVDCTGMFGWSAILVAVHGNHLETLRLLMQYKPNVNTCDAHRNTPLIIAAKEGRVEIVRLLLKARAFVNLSDEYGNTALIHASKANQVAIVDLLIKNHANVDHCALDKKTALFWAVEKGNQQVVERLLQSRPNLELVTKEGESCLMKAVKMRKLNLVQLLLNHHAKASTVDRNGDTALHVAIRMQSTQIVQLILSNPKNQQLLSKQNKARQTPMMLAKGVFSSNEHIREQIYSITLADAQSKKSAEAASLQLAASNQTLAQNLRAES